MFADMAAWELVCTLLSNLVRWQPLRIGVFVAKRHYAEANCKELNGTNRPTKGGYQQGLPLDPPREIDKQLKK